ncbi:MAG: SDR family oxidoreductase [Thermoleophilaceae bacterium]|nr:SDR family oxidoreductase [Thermoleophilaceae bacterium]
MDLGLKDRVALVMGASSGMGKAVAAGLIAEGARVAIASSSPERIAKAAAELGATAFVADANDREAMTALIDEVQLQLGPIEILITNTGGPPPNGDPLEMTPAQWEAAYRTLVMAPMALIERVVPGMKERGFGRIVNVSSTSVREPIPNLMLSNVHRSAALAAFKTVARDLAPHGITVNTVLPGRIATDRLGQLYGSLDNAQEVAAGEIPAGRLGTPQEYAAMVVFLCSDQAAYVTGTAPRVDGGLTRSV